MRASGEFPKESLDLVRVSVGIGISVRMGTDGQWVTAANFIRR